MKKQLLNLVLLLTAATLSAQAPEKLPMDPEVRYGKLDNGLTYYIRHNEQPKQRAEFNVVNDLPAMRKLFDQWPTPIYQNPFELGKMVMYPASAKPSPASSQRPVSE